MLRIMGSGCRMCDRLRFRFFPLCASCLDRFGREAVGIPKPRTLEEGFCLHSAFRYEGFPRALFLRAKFLGDRALADFLISAAFPRIPFLFDARVLIPVPPDRERLIRRGTAFPDRMAYRFSRLSGCPWTPEGTLPATPQESKFLDRRGRSVRRERWSSTTIRKPIPKDGLFLLDDLAATGQTLIAFHDFWTSKGYGVSGSATLFDVPSFVPGSEAGVEP
jgi:predicted amidophosphoribosyltransferase